MVRELNHSRRKFLRSGTATSIGLVMGGVVSRNSVQVVAASATNPHWTMTGNSQTIVPDGPPTPEGYDEYTFNLGVGLNYIESYEPTDGVGDYLHEFTYSGKSISTFRNAGESSESLSSDLLGQRLEVTEYSGDPYMLLSDDPFNQAPPFGVRPTSNGGSDLNYGEAAEIIVDTAISEALDYYQSGLDIAYGAVKAVDAMVDSGNTNNSETKLDYQSDHWYSAENESYARFMTRHTMTLDAEIRLHSTVDTGPNGSGNAPVNMYVYFPNGTDVQKGGSSSIESMSAPSSRSPSELRNNGYRLLSNSPEIEVLGTIPANEVKKRPQLSKLANGGPVRRIRYPMWGKVESVTEYESNQ